MPFKSKSQERAAFGGFLGPEMKAKASEWAAVTDQKSLPKRVSKKKKYTKEAVKAAIKDGN